MLGNASNVNTSLTRTFTVDTGIPSVSLNAPANDTWQTSGTVVFNYTATDTNLKNCTLYGDFSGTWGANESNTSVNSGAWDTISITLTNGSYIWNVLCYDYAGNSNFSQNNYTLYV